MARLGNECQALLLHRRPWPLERGFTPDGGRRSIISDGGEANSIILAEQPGDDARASTVSTRAVFAALRDADQADLERETPDFRVPSGGPLGPSIPQPC